MRRMLFAVIITTLVGVAVASGAKEGGAPNNNDLFKSIIGKVTKLKKKPQGGKVKHIRMNQAQQHLANYTGVAPQVHSVPLPPSPASSCLNCYSMPVSCWCRSSWGTLMATQPSTPAMQEARLSEQYSTATTTAPSPPPARLSHAPCAAPQFPHSTCPCKQPALTCYDPPHRMHAGKQKYFLRKRGLILDDSTLTKDAAFVLASTAYPNGIRVITLDKLHFNYGIALESIWVLPSNRPALLPRASCTPSCSPAVATQQLLHPAGNGR